MSNRYTSITLKDYKHCGIAEIGRKTKAEMIESWKIRAQRMLIEANNILNSEYDDFIVETYIGSIVERNKEVVE